MRLVRGIKQYQTIYAQPSRTCRKASNAATASLDPAFAQWIGLVSEGIVPSGALPDFFAYLAADSALETAHASQHESRSVCPRSISTFEFQNNPLFIFANVYRMSIGKILIEL